MLKKDYVGKFNNTEFYADKNIEQAVEEMLIDFFPLIYRITSIVEYSVDWLVLPIQSCCNTSVSNFLTIIHGMKMH